MTGDNKKRIHVNIQGRVQGVGFRYFVQRKAVDYELTGWVKNLWDRSVELVAEGDETGLENLLAAVRRGPSGSNVTNVDSTWEEYQGEFESFRINWI